MIFIKGRMLNLIIIFLHLVEINYHKSLKTNTMTKDSLRAYVLLGFDKLMKADNYKLFKAKIGEILDKNENQDSNELAKD